MSMITPEQAAALATVPVDVTAYLAVKGGCCWRHAQAGTVGACMCSIPPADLAALVEQRCETCQGTGQGPLIVDFGNGGPTPRCRSCHDGKPLHTIQHECQHRFCSLDKRGQGIEWTCDHWQNDGLIPAPGLWTYDALLPVWTVGDDGYPPEAPDRFVYVSKPGSLRLVDRSDPSDTYVGHAIGTPEPHHFVLAVTRRTP